MQRCQTRKRLALRVECSGGGERYYELDRVILVHPGSGRYLGRATMLRGFRMVRDRNLGQPVQVVPERVGRPLEGSGAHVVVATVTEAELARLVHPRRA